MKGVFITYLYDIQNDERFNEIKAVLIENMKNSFFKKVVIFFEDFASVNKQKYCFLKDAIIIDNGKRRQNYKDLFDYGNQFYKDHYIIISNTDILFDKTINRISEIEFDDKKCLALTRWNPDPNDSTKHKLELQYNKNVAWSFDTYVFKSPLNCDVETLDIEVGYGGCDTLLVKRLAYENLVYITNPCLDIRSFHIHPPTAIRQNVATYFNGSDYPWAFNKERNNSKLHTLDIHDGVEVTFIDSKINTLGYNMILVQTLNY